MQPFFFCLVKLATYKIKMNLLKINIIFFSTILMALSSFSALAQVAHVKSSCFCIEESNAQPNTLYEYIVSQGDWVKTAPIEYKGEEKLAERMESMAMNPVDNIIYAFDADKFGTIEIGTEEFELISSNLKGSGIINGTPYNDFSLSDIDGLTYNPYTRELWATNRRVGTNANDVLFKINPETGEVIKGTFGAYDFVEIEESFDSTFGGSVFDVDDIAINPFTNDLFAIQNQDKPGVVTEIDKVDGSIEREIFDLHEDDVEGLGFSGYGFLYGVTGDDSDIASSLVAIDFVDLTTEPLDPIDLNLADGVGDFESFDCISDYVDLALKAKMKNQNEFEIGDEVEIDVIIYNQGTIDIDKVEIIMHMPSGITMVSNNWVNAGGIKRKRTITKTEQIITAGTNYTVTVKLRLDNPALGDLKIPFEIFKAQNDIISSGQGFTINLPDVDSTPDSNNFETNVINNVINQNAKFEGGDEDDHDIAAFTVVNEIECPQHLVLPNLNLPTYSAGNTIQTSGEVNNVEEIEMSAGIEITFDIGFEVIVGGELTAHIQGCP